MIYIRGNGRFGNQFFRNIFGYFMAKKYPNAGIIYQNPKTFHPIFLPFENKRCADLPQTKQMNEKDYVYFLEREQDTLDYNLIVQDYGQTTNFAKFLVENFAKEFQESIESQNPYKERYRKNKDVFVHVRIGDLEELKCMNPKEYYEKALDEIKAKDGWEKGYITSDSPNHPLIKSLSSTYELEIISKQYTMEHTLLFGSTCKYLVLSLGTFSWLLGLYAFYSDMYYLNPDQVKYWHGPIFQGTSWNRVDLDVEKYPFRYFQNKEFYTNNYMFGKDQICFVHIPKTGGTTIKRLKEKFALPLFIPFNHLPVSHSCPPETYKYLFVMRNPIHRVWSYFHHVKRSAKSFPYKNVSGSIRQFCEHCWEVQNMTTRYLASEYRENILRSWDDIFALAVERMRYMYVIDFDHFDRDLKDFIKQIKPEINIDALEIPNVRNVSYNRLIPLEARKIIEKYNHYDIEFYKRFLKGKDFISA